MLVPSSYACWLFDFAFSLLFDQRGLTVRSFFRFSGAVYLERLLG